MVQTKLMLGGIVLLLSTLLGCFGISNGGATRSLPSKEEQIKASMLHLLEEKYGETFMIEQIDRQDANMAFSKDTFTASVHSESFSETFTARVDADGKDLVDNYPSLYWNDAIESRVQQVLDGAEGLTDIRWNVIYVLSAQTWKQEDDLNAYLAQGETYLDLTLTLPNDLNEASDNLGALCDALQKAHLQYAVACNCAGKTVIFSQKKDQPQLTREQIDQKLERSLS